MAASLHISEAQAEEIAHVYYGVGGKAERLALQRVHRLPGSFSAVP